MSNNSHFGLFVGAFALMSLASVYGSEFGPALLMPAAHADEIALPGGIAGDAAIKSFAPRQLTLPPGLPPAVVSRANTAPTLHPILAKAELPARADTDDTDANDGGVTVLPSPASCPSANPDIRLGPVPATLADPPIRRPLGPQAGLGTGTACPAAFPHISVIAGAAPAPRAPRRPQALRMRRL